MAMGVAGCGGDTSSKEPVDLAEINKDDFIKGYTNLYKEDKDITIEKINTYELEADATSSGNVEISERYEIKNKDKEICKMGVQYDKKTKKATIIMFSYENEKMPDFFNSCVDNAVHLVSAESWPTLAWDYKSFGEEMMYEKEINGVYYSIYYDDGKSISESLPDEDPKSVALITFEIGRAHV